jgi:hypothetical protein
VRTTPIRQRGLLVRLVAALSLGLGGLVATVGLLGVVPAQANTGLTAGPSFTIDTTEGVSTGTVEVGTFTDSNPVAPVSDFTASINWGDGTSTETGTVSQPGGVGTAFVVTGSHTYVTTGTFTPNVDVSGDGGSLTILDTVNVADPLTAGPSFTIDTTEGVSTGTVEVGTFTDSNPTAPVSDFTASINWGDGTSTATGTVSQPGGVGTAFVVTGSHTYAATGTFTPNVDVSGDGGSLTILDTVNVADPLTAGPSLTIDATEGTSTGSVEVGTFTDSNPTAPISDFTASINWGDGTSTDTGTISQPGGVGTTFVVTGSHTYFAAGTFTASVDVSGDGGTVTLLATVKVASPCASGTAYFLTATSRTGNFTGLFCANAAGTGPYTQSGGATGTGTIKLSGGTTWISASGKNLALLGEKSSAVNTFTETAPGPMKSGTFTLIP